MPCLCHLGNRRKYARGGRSAQIILSVVLSFVAFSLAKDATASTGIAISSNGLGFGSVAVGTSLTRRVTLTNVGTCSITVSQATVTGAGLSISGLVLPLTLDARHNATFNVEFAPAVGGSVTGTLSIVSNASNRPNSLSLSGTGVAQPTANLSPPSTTFASQALESTSSAQAVTVTHSGDTTLNTTGLAPTGAYASDFAQTNDCGASVAARTNCATNVSFKPAASGTRAAAVTLTDNGTVSPQSILFGRGSAAVSLSPTSLAFGSQTVGKTSKARTVSLRNTGNATLIISSIVVNGTNRTNFAETNTCGRWVAAGSSCTISVTFTPSANASRRASVSITDSARGSPQTVSLSGTGTLTASTPTAPVDGLSPTSLAFGNQPVGTTSAPQTVTLSNSGNATLSITSLVLTGTNASDFAQTNTCGSSVAASANCTINVTFMPAAGGSRTASVSITDNASGSPQSVSLSGTGTAAAVSLSPTSLAFGNQSLGVTSAAQTLTLGNTGTAALSITSLALTGTNASDFAQTNTCGSPVAAGSNCTISVTFKPAASGSRTASVSITDNASGSPQSVSLSGTGTAVVVSLSPTSLAFGNQSVGTTSAPQTVTLSNTGNAALSITSLALTGTNASDFTQTNTCGSSVAAGSNCTITVTFKPAASGSRTASVSITDNASGSPQSVSLSGTGTAVVVSLSPTSLAFGNQSVGTTSAPQTVTLSNTGTAALSITSLALTGTNASDFAQTNTCGSSVAASANCTITVTFTPSASGSRTASVSITDNASGSPQTVSLSGTGTAALASLSPTSLAFGNQSLGVTSAAQTLTLSNTGNATLSITSLGLTGTNASDFAQTNTCGSPVAASANCTITVTFTPAASGSRTASVSITDNASGSPQTVSLSGTGTAALVSLSPTSLAFGNQPADMTSAAQTVTLSNTGNAALSITSLAMVGTNASDFAQSNTCGNSLAAGANCTIAVMFTPSVAGTEAASLSIADNASGSPQTASLSGAGTHDVILTWTASTTPGVGGYNVFRGATSGGEGAMPLNSSPINGTTYCDSTVQAGQTYYYVITAVASNDVTQSAASNEVSATVP